MTTKSGKSVKKPTVKKPTVKKPTVKKLQGKTAEKPQDAVEDTAAELAGKPASAKASSESGKKTAASSEKPVDAGPSPDAVTPEAARASGEPRSWFTEGRATLFISILALIIASGSLAYVITIERNAGLLANSARAVMAKAGIATTPASPDKATMLSSIQYLSSAARGSEPFSTELAVTYKMVGDHPEIGKVLDEILPGAETGIPSVEDVTTSYADIISGIYGYGPGQLLGQAASSITSIVGIKTSAQQRQATIEQVTVLVAAGKLAEALKELNKLDGQARLPFAAWQIKAQRRVALDAAVSEIKRIAFLSILDGAS